MLKFTDDDENKSLFLKTLRQNDRKKEEEEGCTTSNNNTNNNNKKMSTCDLNLNVKRLTGLHHSSSSSKPLLPSFSRSLIIPWLFLLIFSSSCWILPVNGAEEDCPWFENERVPVTIKSNCLCARNRTSYNQLSVQCHEIDGQQLVSILLANRAGLSPNEPLELLYLNGSHVTDSNGQIPARLFRELKLRSVQLSGCNIKSVHPEAFRGQENVMKHLSLAQNKLTEVPTTALERLKDLALLDISYNKIQKIPQNAFETLTKLSTLKLNDNNLELDPNCFKGLENSLRNLNLKGTRISIIPEAIANLSSLAFLDLAQNRLRDLEPLPFIRLHSLTVLNLERNLLQSLPESVFIGVNDTLSSLSLLNNLITNFPTEALHPLKELRVLDLGFNLLTEIPHDAFTGLSALTLLALDGNPLSSLLHSSFTPLNSTLRGLSLGGRFLTCDCRIKWVYDWIHDYDLQVTSRERNPQFCGSPPALRQYNFYQIQSEDFKCEKNETLPTSTSSKGTDANDGSPEDLTVLGVNSKPFIQNEETDETTGKINRNRHHLLKPKLKISSVQRQPLLTSNNRREPPPPSSSPPPPPSPSQQSEPELTDKNGKDKVTSLTAPSSYENDDEYESDNDSQEIHDTASSNSEPVEKPVVVHTLPTPFRTRTSTTTLSPRSSPISTTRKVLTIPSVIKPFPGVRPKPSQPKVITSTTTSTSVTSTSTSSTARDVQDAQSQSSSQSFRNQSASPPIARSSTATSTTTTTTTTNPTPVASTLKPSTNVLTINRFIPSESVQIRNPSVSFDGPEFDDSHIPVITGVGPVRTISGNGNAIPNTHNAGSVISVKHGTTSSSGSATSQTQAAPPPPPPQTSPSLSNRPPNLIFAEKSEILLKDIERHGDMVLLQWESQKHVVGFRIIYRIFGDESFRHGPPLAATEREYRIKNIPNNECIVVCVVPYDDILYNEISPSASSVPPGSQCRELKPSSPSALMSNMDKITIGASVAICATVLLAVFIFILITRRSKSRRSTSGLISKVPPGSMMSPSPGPPNMINPGGLIKEWDQLSAISARSIPRARVYHGNSMIEGSMGNGLHHAGTSRSVVLPVQQQRSVPDGHSTHRSYLSSHHAHHNHSMHGYGHSNGHISTHSSTSAAVNNYLNNQSRLLRASLGSRSSQDALNKQLGPSTHVHRHFEQNQKRRRPGVAGRLSQSDSLNTLSGYETPDNWTDHDIDVYVARNATRHDLVQL